MTNGCLLSYHQPWRPCSVNGRWPTSLLIICLHPVSQCSIAIMGLPRYSSIVTYNNLHQSKEFSTDPVTRRIQTVGHLISRAKGWGWGRHLDQY